MLLVLVSSVRPGNPLPFPVTQKRVLRLRGRAWSEQQARWNWHHSLSIMSSCACEALQPLCVVYVLFLQQQKSTALVLEADIALQIHCNHFPGPRPSYLGALVASIWLPGALVNSSPPARNPSILNHMLEDSVALKSSTEQMCRQIILFPSVAEQSQHPCLPAMGGCSLQEAGDQAATRHPLKRPGTAYPHNEAHAPHMSDIHCNISHLQAGHSCTTCISGQLQLSTRLWTAAPQTSAKETKKDAN